MHFRKYKDGSTTEFEPEEIAIINNSLVATNDSWLTSKAAFGKYKIGDEERWGPIAEYVTADTIEGKFISGGSLRIGGREGDKGEFIVTEHGEVIIRGNNGEEKYAAKELENAYSFQVMLEYIGQVIFYDQEQDDCEIVCKIFHNGQDITDKVMAQSGRKFEWRNSSDSSWSDQNNVPYIYDFDTRIDNRIKVTHEHINRNAQITCSVEFDTTEFEQQQKEVLPNE
jgi:hypothetical protein